MGERIQVSTRTVRHYEAGTKRPHMSRLRLIAEVLGQSVGWFLGERRAGPRQPPKSARSAPIQSAGTWEVALEDASRTENLFWLYAPEKTLAYRVSSEEMVPIFLPGDLLFVDPERGCEPDRFVLAILENGSLVVRRVELRSDVTFLTAQARNSNLYPLDTGIRVLGQIVGLMRDL